ncbi:hypothetical protein CDAR_30781 [Caerostris darwini]|uniref:Uncharacterized protein n=1 Tax=Caerostris darwini TaxID=1538125 RepID=A0AAV4SF92_9ARAC|nr:hypothetical protein CDAR_30781 [Caerostris darwini]
MELLGIIQKKITNGVKVQLQIRKIPRTMRRPAFEYYSLHPLFFEVYRLVIPLGEYQKKKSEKDFAFSFGFLKGLDLSIFRGLNFWEISRLDLTFPLLIPRAF